MKVPNSKNLYAMHEARMWIKDVVIPVITTIALLKKSNNENHAPANKTKERTYHPEFVVVDDQ